MKNMKMSEELLALLNDATAREMQVSMQCARGRCRYLIANPD
jgi:hypothetical protein